MLCENGMQIKRRRQFFFISDDNKGEKILNSEEEVL